MARLSPPGPPPPTAAAAAASTTRHQVIAIQPALASASRAAAVTVAISVRRRTNAAGVATAAVVHAVHGVVEAHAAVDDAVVALRARAGGWVGGWSPGWRGGGCGATEFVVDMEDASVGLGWEVLVSEE